MMCPSECMIQPGSYSKCSNTGTCTDKKNYIMQKLVEELQIDLFYKCVGFFASVYHIFKAVDTYLKVNTYLMALSLKVH